jgi:hypothetical protein
MNTEPKTYIELFHEDRFDLEAGRKWNVEGRRLAEEVDKWIEEGYEIYYHPHWDFDDPPLVPVAPDTPMIVGGIFWGQSTFCHTII